MFKTRVACLITCVENFQIYIPQYGTTFQFVPEWNSFQNSGKTLYFLNHASKRGGGEGVCRKNNERKTTNSFMPMQGDRDKIKNV